MAVTAVKAAKEPGRAERPLAERLKDIGRIQQNGAGGKAERAAWAILAGDKARRQPTPSSAAERAECQSMIAKGLYLLADYGGAAAAAAKALSFAPGRIDLLCLKSGALRLWGRLEESEQAAREALALSPFSFDAADMLIAVLFEAGKPEAALQGAQEMVARQPRSSQAHVLLGRALTLHGRLEDAANAFKAALAADNPDSATVLGHLGNVHHDLCRHEEAEAYYRRALSFKPNAMPSVYGIVNTLKAAGKHAEAKAAFRKAAASLPRYADHFFDFLYPIRAAEVPSGPLDSRKAVLVFPPAEMPAIPLGITLLKAHAEKDTDYTITCLDLNQQMFRHIVDGMKAGATSVRFADQDDFLKAADLFLNGGTDFFDPLAYGQANDTLIKYFSLINETIRSRCKIATASGTPVPWFVQAYARQILEGGAKVIGFSIMFTEQMPFATMLARAVKQVRPDCVVVFGGGFFNDNGLESFLASHFVDYVCVHEGEGVFRSLMEALNGKGDPKDVGGIHYRDEATGKFVEVPNLIGLKHNEIPFAAVSDLDLKGYFMPEPVMPMISSRGCYWRRCTFCNHFASYATTYKTQSIDRVVTELEHHWKVNGIRHFTFVDEMISAARLKKLSEDIIERGLDINWYALAKPTPDFTADVFETMYKAGCKCIYWGLESGSERILAMMDKGNTAQSSSESLKLAAAAGIRNHCFLIIGFPTETKKDLIDTMALLHDAQDSVDKLIVNPFVLEKGTPIFDHPDQFGLTKVYDVRSLCNSEYVAYEAPKGTTTRDAAAIADRLRPAFFDKFSNRGTSFGVIRDHVIILYGAQEQRESMAADVPPVSEIMHLIDLANDGTPVEGTRTVIQPLWDRE
jgi:anaerobic magnesium-protoporphyrin IX monomethyl ester cyclase